MHKNNPRTHSPQQYKKAMLPAYCLFHETFAPIEKSEMKLVGVLWHEAIKGRSIEDIASTFTFFIRKIWFLDG